MTVLFPNLPLVGPLQKRVRDAVPPCWPNGRTKVPSHSPESFCRKGAPIVLVYSHHRFRWYCDSTRRLLRAPAAAHSRHSGNGSGAGPSYIGGDPNPNTQAYANSDSCSYANTQAYANSDSCSYANTQAYANSDSCSYANTQAYANSDSDAFADSNRNPTGLAKYRRLVPEPRFRAGVCCASGDHGAGG